MAKVHPDLPHLRGDRYRISRIDGGAIKEFYLRHPSLGNGFNQPSFLQTLATSFGREVVHLGLDRAGSLEAVASLLVQRIGPIGNAQSLPIRYTGLESVNSHDVPSQVLALRKWLAGPKRRIGRAHYSFPPAVVFDPSELELGGVSVKYNETCVLDLEEISDENGIPLGANRRMKERLRQTWRHGVVVRDSWSSDVVDAMPRLLESTYVRNKGVSPYPTDFGNLLWNRHGDDPAFTMKTAHIGSAPNVVGMAIGITHNQRMYSFIIAKDNEDEASKNLNVNGVLITEMARRAKEIGCTHYDLGGGTPGIIDFKRRMGSRTAPYANVTTAHPAYTAAFLCWEGLKRFREWTMGESRRR